MGGPRSTTVWEPFPGASHGVQGPPGHQGCRGSTLWTFSVCPRILLSPLHPLHQGRGFLALCFGWAQPMRHTSEGLQRRRRMRLGSTCPLLGRSLVWPHPSGKDTLTTFSTHLSPDSRSCSLLSPGLDPSVLTGPALSLFSSL